MLFENRPNFRLRRPALLLASAFLLISCNGAGGPSAGFPKAVTSANVEKIENDRTMAMRILAAKLTTQKQALQRPVVAKLESQASKPLPSVPVPSKVVEPAPVKLASLAPEPAPAPLPETQDRLSGHYTGPLGRFRAKLDALKAGQRSTPVTILHIGDSHVASDSFSRGIRKALQARFGDAGRGMVIPAGAFKYGVADQVKFSHAGKWRSKTALRNKKVRYGISGVSVASRSSRSSMTLTSHNGIFDWAAVTVATGPSQGQVKLTVGDKVKAFDAYAKKQGSARFQIEARGRRLTVTPGGGAQTTVLSWSTGKNSPGVRYVNFGLIGATVDITRRFDGDLVANDVRRLNPDLIIYGYGTNEGFQDNLNLKRYYKRAERFVAKLRKNAPNADFVYIGAASGLRKKGNKACSGWSTPPKLAPLRAMVRKMAQEQNAAYWDWSEEMGGACAINRWAAQGLAAKDRVHLTSKGYARSAEAFAKWLATSSEQVALN